MKQLSMDTSQDLQIKLSKGSTRKYPNVMWFPRSKTDPQEIREVLKIALKTQESNKESYFNDKILGETMARIGSINVVGKLGEEYIESYKDKSTGDVSYITNARMLMRFFRFLGLVSRIAPAKYILTDLGLVYSKFKGDFPASVDGQNEEQMLLQSLGNFAFYSINDDSSYRDGNFKTRPFVWLLNSLAIEPQCIYQLIVTAFASKQESIKEVGRIKIMLKNLRQGKTTLKEEFKRLGLDADDYSCVHNFYDSAKILVYVGSSLGLITKTTDKNYGRKIIGNARHMKQAHTFYLLTDKGKRFLNEMMERRLLYYSDLYDLLDKKILLQAVFILCSLNFTLGSKKIENIKAEFFDKLFGVNWIEIIDILKKLEIEITIDNNLIRLVTPLSFNFWQSIPPEIFYLDTLNSWYRLLIAEVNNEKSAVLNITIHKIKDEFSGEVISEFILDKAKGISYKLPDLDIPDAEKYIKYPDKDSIFGGQDRFASRISPTNSVLLIGSKVHVDNEKDALDLLIPLRTPNDALKGFIHDNIDLLIKNFEKKTDNWEKDQHYTWIRNCFRLFGANAIYSGSSGMLMRADVSVIEPFIGGIEAKSPRENRGSIATKAIRQAVDAKIQVAAKILDKKELPRAAIAVGRRITPLAIEEERKWQKEEQPVLLLSDLVLYYLTLKTIDINFTKEDIVDIFTKNSGLLTKTKLADTLVRIIKRHNLSKETQERVLSEIGRLDLVISGENVEEVEE